MSIIAFDGKIVAADRQATIADMRTTSQKIFKIKDVIVGFTGCNDKGLELVEWFKNGERKDVFPKSNDKDNWSRLCVFKKNNIYYYEATPEKIIVKDKRIAYGSGRDFAIGAMEFGANAIEAVKVACKYSVGCGMGIQYFKI